MKISTMLATLGHFVAAAIAVPLAAQSERETITARQPAGIVIALLNADYDAELTTDSVDDPLIRFDNGGYKFSILFYGCDETRHDNCDSVQLRVSFDRGKPLAAAEAMAATTVRYASVSIDEEGDTTINWDIVTGDGIPKVVFLDSIERFEDIVAQTAEKTFAEEIAAAENEDGTTP